VAIDPQPEAAVPAGGPGAPPAAGPDGGAVGAAGPWHLAYRRFLRNRLAVAFLGLFVLIVIFVLAAPLWADNVAETGPNKSHTLEQLHVGDETRDVVTP